MLDDVFIWQMHRCVRRTNSGGYKNVIYGTLWKWRKKYDRPEGKVQYGRVL
jgi:hypothetical protein